ncbi:MAG: sigma 54-interacting transcriptional regulator [Actinomycetia bacterium]|nr:sigma 54-interacting transcriptional regulator [Actinomycetes bacterium]
MIERLALSAETQAQIYRAWERFLAQGEEPRGVPEPIAESWKASRELGVDPLMAKAPCLPDCDIPSLQQQHRRLLQVSGDILQQVHDEIAAVDTVVILSDSAGTILDMVGNPATVERARAVNISVGGLFGLGASGTNGLALAHALRTPALVVQSQHYCEMLHPWSCFSLPLASRSGHPLGILDVTAYRNIFHPHTLAMLQVLGRLLVERWDAEEARDHTVLREAFERTRRQYPGDRVVTVTRWGDVVAGLPAAPTGWRPILEGGFLGEHPGTFVAVSPLSDSEAVTHQAWPVRRGDDLVGWVLVAPDRRRAGHPAPSSATPPTADRITSVDDLWGESPVFRAVLELARRAATSDSPVLLLGETGTGKELVARAIHAESGRAGPFVAVNCGAIPPDLLGSELFGYEEGAFSGARRGGKKGYFEQAEGGTLFLDEIAELPADLQVYLLRALEDGRIRRLGGTRDIPVHVRVIAATNQDLEQATARGAFREDLFYRLNVVTLRLPPLRDRGPAEVRLLGARFLEASNARHHKRVELTPQAWELLVGYSWPGNVRALRNVIERVVTLSEPAACLSPPDLVALCPDLAHALAQAEAGDGGAGRSPTLSAAPAESGGRRRRGGPTFHDSFEDLLAELGGNVSAVARRLGVSRSTIYRRLKHMRN